MDGAIILVVAITLGVDFGWETNDLGELEYIIQIDPLSLDAMQNGQIITSEIHPEVRGVRHFRIQVGREELPRDAGLVVPAEPTVQLNPVVVTEPPEDFAVDASATNAPSLSIQDLDSVDLEQRGETSRFSNKNFVNPNTVDPNTVDPNTVDPNTVDPNTVDPNTVDPNVVDPNVVNLADGIAGGQTSVIQSPPTELVSPPDPPALGAAAVPTLSTPDDVRNFDQALNHHDEVDTSDEIVEPSEAFRRDYGNEYSHQSQPARAAHDTHDVRPVSVPQSDDQSHTVDFYSDNPPQPLAETDNNKTSSLTPKNPLSISSVPDRHDIPVEYSNPVNESGAVRRTSVDHETDEDHGYEEARQPSLQNQRSPFRPSTIQTGIGVEDTVEQTTSSKPWPWVLAFFAALASNVFMGWVTWTAVYRYRELVDDMRPAG